MVGGLGALKLASAVRSGVSILVATTLVGTLLASIGLVAAAGPAVALLFGVGVGGASRSR